VLLRRAKVFVLADVLTREKYPVRRLDDYFGLNRFAIGDTSVRILIRHLYKSTMNVYWYYAEGEKRCFSRVFEVRVGYSEKIELKRAVIIERDDVDHLRRMLQSAIVKHLAGKQLVPRLSYLFILLCAEKNRRNRQLSRSPQFCILCQEKID